LVSNGVPYYSEAGAEGFFFAGYGTDFHQKFYSENLGFIAKTSESRNGISNCITTYFYDSGFATAAYGSSAFAEDAAMDVTDALWTLYITPVLETWEAS